MKKFSVLLIFAMMMACFASIPVIAAESAENSIKVTGQASVKVKPDIAYVYVGVETSNTDAKIAQEENAKTMQNVLAVIKGLGIAENDIQTETYYIYPRYDISYENIIGYTARNGVTVTVRDLDNISQVIDKAVEAGANAGGNIQFALADQEKYYFEAMGLAVKNAQSKAGVLANALGVSVGAPVAVEEQSTYYPQAVYSEMMRDSGDMSYGGSVSTPVETREIEVSARVTAVYIY